MVNCLHESSIQFDSVLIKEPVACGCGQEYIFKGLPGQDVVGHHPHSACSDSRGQRLYPSSPVLGRSP